jgi:hypothetical protein
LHWSFAQIDAATAKPVSQIDICARLRTWKHHAWLRRRMPALAGEVEVVGRGDMWSGIRLDDEQIHRAVLARRGMPNQSIEALLEPIGFLLALVEPAKPEDDARRRDGPAAHVGVASAIRAITRELRQPDA